MLRRRHGFQILLILPLHALYIICRQLSRQVRILAEILVAPPVSRVARQVDRRAPEMLLIAVLIIIGAAFVGDRRTHLLYLLPVPRLAHRQAHRITGHVHRAPFERSEKAVGRLAPVIVVGNPEPRNRRPVIAELVYLFLQCHL